MMLYKITAKWDDAADGSYNDAVGWMMDRLSSLGCYDVEIDEINEPPKPHVGGGPKPSEQKVPSSEAVARRHRERGGKL